MKVKAIIFDLDGTLVSVKKEYRHELVRYVLKKLNKKASKEEMDQFWFMHSRDSIIRKWGLEPKEFWKVFHIADKEDVRKKNTFVFRDIDVLEKFKKKGVKLALYTGTRPNIAAIEIELLKKGLFDAIVIANQMTNFKIKPHPMGAFECLRLLGTKKEETIYVGNADEDILTARNAGIFSVLIDRKEHKNALKADMKIESLYDLEKLI